MKTSTKRILIRLAIFFTIFSTVFAYLSAVFFPKWKNIDNTKPAIETFYAQLPDSIDVLFLGTSSFRNGFSPMTTWEESGITSYLRATAGQLPLVSYYYLVEALKYQHPKVVVLEGASLFNNTNVDKNEASLRKSVDPMRLSAVKLRLIKDVVDRSENQTFISYLLPFLRYHDRWKDLTQADFQYWQIDTFDPFRGQYLTRGKKPLLTYSGLEVTNEVNTAYNPDALVYYRKIIQLCQDKGIGIILVTLPRIEGFSYAEHAGIQRFADQYGMQYIDYNLPTVLSATGLQAMEDYQNPEHLNVYGSQKVSRYFVEILQSEYSFTDKRNESDYQNWNIDLETFHRDLL